MSAYFLFDNVEVRDPVALAGYAKQAVKIVAEHGGRYVALDAVPEVVEGVNPGLRSVVLMEFPDVASARAWYDAPVYQPFKAIRHRAVLNNAVLIAG
jgi:uncharacterized protein (DUF1330 family)